MSGPQSSGPPRVASIATNAPSFNARTAHLRRCSADHVITVEPRAAEQPLPVCREDHGHDDELGAPLLPAPPPPEPPALHRQILAANGLSWAVNILLLVAKIWAYLASDSKAVLASAADSGVDLLSQVVITYTESRMRAPDPRYPVGQARLEALGVLACACIMSVASFAVVQESVLTLYRGMAEGVVDPLDLSRMLFVVLGVAVGLKALCYVACAALADRSDSMLALAEDHLNDILSNAAAIATAVAAWAYPSGWWVDPAGAIAISLYIVWRWAAIARQQVHKIVGHGAPVDFVGSLTDLANSHHVQCTLDVIRAYHFGARYIVEMEIVLPADMTVAESHDISLALQHKVEALPEVERAFVHVDYQRRDTPEHKVERALLLAPQGSGGAQLPPANGGAAAAAAAGQDA